MVFNSASQLRVSSYRGSKVPVLHAPHCSKLRAGAAASRPRAMLSKPQAMPSHKVNLVTAYRITPLPKQSRPVDC
jgi:hypothetical protein